MCTTNRRYANSTFEDTCDAMRKIAPTNRLRPDHQRVMLALPTQDASTPSGKHRIGEAAADDGTPDGSPVKATRQTNTSHATVARSKPANGIERHPGSRLSCVPCTIVRKRSRLARSAIKRRNPKGKDQSERSPVPRPFRPCVSFHCPPDVFQCRFDVVVDVVDTDGVKRFEVRVPSRVVLSVIVRSIDLL